MATKNFIIKQGKTFSQLIRWEKAPIVYKEITGIFQSAPCEITCPAHDIPDGWRVAVVSVKGMTEINAESPVKEKDYIQATVLSSDTISLNGVNSSDYKPYISGGYLQYYTPVDIGPLEARMSIKDKVGGTELFSITTENGGIEIDNTNQVITLLISATDTASFNFKKGVYDIEMVSPSGVVTELLSGTISVSKEVTTEV